MGNIALNRIPRTASDREMKPGEEFQLDIELGTSDCKALKHRQAFGKFAGALAAVDPSTDYRIGKLLKSHAALVL